MRDIKGVLIRSWGEEGGGGWMLRFAADTNLFYFLEGWLMRLMPRHKNPHHRRRGLVKVLCA